MLARDEVAGRRERVSDHHRPMVDRCVRRAPRIPDHSLSLRMTA